MATTTEYDLDTSGGLMPQILQLIAPPPSDTPSNKDKIVKKKITDKDEQPRRRARTQNRDTCDSCGECGNLICCEKCPAALHLACVNPPLPDVPMGEWLCANCSGELRTPLTGNENPVELLIRAALTANSSMFQPKKPDYLPIFPDCDKGPQKIVSRRSSAQKKPPEKYCFECTRGSRVASLLCCDFCPLAYHLDCLNPPLASMPHSTWLCPNHYQHGVDMSLTTTLGSERGQLWDRFKTIDVEALKLQFLRIGARKNPPFRFRVKQPQRGRVVVPQSIQSQYENPRPSPQILTAHANLESKPIEKPKPEEAEEWLKGLVALQMAFVDKVFDKKTQDEDIKIEENVESAIEEILNVPKKKILRESQNIPQKNPELDALLHSNCNISKLDPKLIQILALQRIQQLLSKEDKTIPEVRVKEESIDETFGAFEENLYLKDGVLLAKKKYVAVKDLQGGVTVEECSETTVKPIKGLTETPKVKARAALTPVGGPTLRPRPVQMRYRSFTIGTSLDNDLCLLDFGKCNFISPYHAVIFFDDLTQQFELLNYSKFGTIVDNVVYANDPAQSRVPTQATGGDPVAKAVREMLRRKRGLTGQPLHDQKEMAARVVTTSEPCKCGVPRNETPGWEGSGFVYHCSLLEFGCLQFVFSVVDFAPSLVKQPEEKIEMAENGENKDDEINKKKKKEVKRESNKVKNEDSSTPEPPEN